MVLHLILLSLAAFFGAYLLGARMRMSHAARHWPRHPATVLDSTVTRQWTRLGYLYKITVRCEYAIGDRHTVTEILPSDLGTNRGGYAQRLVNFFRVGATVPVYVDPQRPHVAVLLPGIDDRMWPFLVLMLCVGVGTMIAAISVF